MKVANKMVDRENRLKTLLYNAICMLIDETYQTYNDEYSKGEWVEMMINGLGCTVEELMEYGELDLDILRGC